ncbi:MAG: S16 family serine protease [Candidatus Micrarchaeota archaeon]
MRLFLLLLGMIAIASADCSGSISQSVPAVVGNGGGLVNVTISLAEGPGTAYATTDPRVGYTTQASIEQAAAYALAITGKECDVLVDFSDARSVTSLIEGPSAGTAIAVMTYALLEDKALREDTVMTGSIDPLGRVGAVGGLYEKAKGAAYKGARYFITPVEGFYEALLLRGMEENYGITILQARTVQEVIGFMTENMTIAQTGITVEEREVPDLPDYHFPDRSFRGVAQRMIDAEEDAVLLLPENENDTAAIKSYFTNEVKRQGAISDNGYLFSAANEAFLNYIDIETVKAILADDVDLARRKGEASICLENLERPAITDANFQWVIGADLREAWGMERLGSINATEDLLVEEEYAAYNELMYSQAWCIVAESLLAQAPSGGTPIDEGAWKGIAERKLAEAREAAGESGSSEKLDSAERSFAEGRYGAAIYDSVYVIETSDVGEIDDQNLSGLVGEERISLWGQVYQSHAAFMLAQNMSEGAYSTARYAYGLDEATVEMAQAMGPAVQEEPQERSGEADILYIGAAVGGVLFLLIVLLLLRGRTHGDNRS